MLRIQVPIDIGTVATSQSAVFALVTPMRVRDLLALAVLQALGKRAPAAARERNLASILAGLASRRYALKVDGRLYDDPESCVACSDTVTLRFFTQF